MTPVIVVPNDNLYPRFSSFHGHAFTFLLQRGAIQAQYKWDVSQRCMNLSKQGKIKNKRTEPFDTENRPSGFHYAREAPNKSPE